MTTLRLLHFFIHDLLACRANLITENVALRQQVLVL